MDSVPPTWPMYPVTPKIFGNESVINFGMDKGKNNNVLTICALKMFGKNDLTCLVYRGYWSGVDLQVYHYYRKSVLRQGIHKMAAEIVTLL